MVGVVSSGWARDVGNGVTYRIRIHYREPTYELRIGPRQRPYRWTYAIDAETPQQAKRLAVEEFHELARCSGVGWRREIVLIEMDGGRAS